MATTTTYWLVYCIMYKLACVHSEYSNWSAFSHSLLDLFCSSIQFSRLLSPKLCFIAFLYLALYVLGDDALIS